ncbi:NAD(P)/FAD-dependent oxidoreductase [Chloroflexota bacterium]
MKLYDVIVIGAGPIGSYAAYKLADMGYGVVVLDRKKKPGEKVCCTGIVGQECVSSFHIKDSVILRKANSARLFSPSGKLLRLWRQETQAYILDRTAFDISMASRAQDKGVEYISGCLVKDIEVTRNRARVVAIRQAEEQNFEARAVVVAAGFGSGLAERLCLGKVGDFVMGAQATVETIGIDEIEVYLGREVAPGFFAWLVPTSPNRALVGLLSRHNSGLYLRKLMTSLLAQGKIVSTEADLSYGGVPLKPLIRTYGERLVVTGDTAGMVKPTTGGGIFYGLLGADIAANTLHKALKADNLSAEELADYERKWKKKLGRELKIGYWARKLYERLSDKQIDRIFDIMKSNGIDKALLEANNLSFDWHGEAVLRLIGYRAVSKITRVMKSPFHLRGT